MREFPLRRRRTSAALAAVATVALLGLSACGDDDEADPVATGGAPSATSATSATTGAASDKLAESRANLEKFTKAPTKISPSVPIGKPIPADKLIVHVNCGAEACTQTGRALAEASAVMGWQFKEINAQPTPQSIQAAFQEALRLNADGVASEGFSTATYQRQLAEFEKRGVPVLSNTGTEMPSGGLKLQLQTDVTNKAMALMADKVIVDSGGKAEIGNIILSGYPIVEQYAKDFASRIESNCDDCTVKDLTLQPTSIGKDAAAKISNFLRANPGIKYIFLGYDDLAIGLPAATKAAGVEMPKTYSWAAQKAGLAALRTGERTATVPQDSPQVGWQFADGFARAFTGGDISESQKWSDFVVWSKDYNNIPEDTGAAGLPPTIVDYQQQFKALWGK